MTLIVHARSLDVGLSAFDQECDAIYLCSARPASYADATQTPANGGYALASAPFARGAAFGSPVPDADGRKVVSQPATGLGIANGSMTYWAAVDTTTQRLLASDLLAAPFSVATGQRFSLSSFSVRFHNRQIDGVLAAVETADAALVLGRPAVLSALGATEAADAATLLGFRSLTPAIGTFAATEAADTLRFFAYPAAAGLLAATEAADAAFLLGSGVSQNAYSVSANGRYLLDGSGQPLLLVADSAQTLAVNATPADAHTYLSTRGSQGFNAVQFDVVVTDYAGLNTHANYATLDGVRPFTGALITTPNETYFARIDQLVTWCQQAGLIAMLNPYAIGDDINDLVNAGVTACTNYGTYLGNRYKNSPNVMWQMGNDCIVGSQAGFNCLQAIAQAIRAQAPQQLITMELVAWDPQTNSTAFDQTGYGTFATSMNMQGFYTYAPTYGWGLIAYNQPSVSFGGVAGRNKTPTPCPSILLEANYENGANPGMDGGAYINLRKQNYWVGLCGAAGQIWGNEHIVFHMSGWLNDLASTGVAQLMVWKNFFNSIRWYDLIPDQAHVIGTAGYGTPAITGTFANNDYVALAATADGTLAVAFFPRIPTTPLTVDMSKFAGPITAQWFDPVSGTYTTVTGSPFSNSGTQTFAPSGTNAAGDPDRVLLLNATPSSAPSLSSITPNYGALAGGTAVSLSGSKLTGTNRITFGGTDATNISVISDNLVVCNTPAKAAGAVSVTVYTPNGNATRTSFFTYQAAPTVTSVNPNTGPIAGGGAPVTITGTGFLGTSAVTFGGVAATNVTVTGPTTLTCVPPAHAAGAVNIAVTTPQGTGTGVGLYTYSATSDIWATLDGRAAASNGAIQVPTLVNTYHPVGQADGRNRTGLSVAASVAAGSLQPPWMIAGVDYAVGPHSGTYKIPGVDPTPNGCTLNGSRNGFDVDGVNNVVIDGWDFNGGGQKSGGVDVINGSSGTVITNCRFRGGAKIYSPAGTGNLTIRYNHVTNDGITWATWAAGGGGSLVTFFGYGDIVIEYNSFVRTWHMPIQVAGNPAGAITLRYNYFENGGCGAPPVGNAHAEAIQVFGNQQDYTDISFNTVWQNMNPSAKLDSYVWSVGYTGGRYTEGISVCNNLTIQVAGSGNPYHTQFIPSWINLFAHNDENYADISGVVYGWLTLPGGAGAPVTNDRNVSMKTVGTTTAGSYLRVTDHG